MKAATNKALDPTGVAVPTRMRMDSSGTVEVSLPRITRMWLSFGR
jgi:hypothetical protein